MGLFKVSPAQQAQYQDIMAVKRAKRGPNGKGMDQYQIAHSFVDEPMNFGANPDRYLQAAILLELQALRKLWEGKE